MLYRRVEQLLLVVNFETDRRLNPNLGTKRTLSRDKDEFRGTYPMCVSEIDSPLGDLTDVELDAQLK